MKKLNHKIILLSAITTIGLASCQNSSDASDPITPQKGGVFAHTKEIINDATSAAKKKADEAIEKGKNAAEKIVDETKKKITEGSVEDSKSPHESPNNTK
ncbi:ATP synthase subunit B family protein [Candidatus Liberibacter brunswickensis]|uniref:hypothetical protein n=1 Tax=Candidatus Liberibacter brunswickensis TaxID=1968796 RepID=UPI002FE0C03A